MTKGKAIARDKNTKGTVFAVVSYVDGSYGVYKLCSNYCGQIKGGIRKTWRYVSKDQTKTEAFKLFNKRLAGSQT